jgi:GAF domain-containing protein
MSLTRSSYDSYRDAMKFRQMLLAIEQATTQVRQMERAGRPDIDQVMVHLLPQLAGALDAELAFVATPTGADGSRFKITAVFPSSLPQDHEIDAPLLGKLAGDGRARVIDPLGGEAVEPIEGLQTLGAKTGVFVCMQIEPHLRIVGVCNKIDPGENPFLASDQRMLANIVELVAIGLRVGERHRRQLAAIQETSAAINAELNLDRLLPAIAESAALVFEAPATSLMLWDPSHTELVIQAQYGVSDSRASAHRVPVDAVTAVLGRASPGHPLLIDDLQQSFLGALEQDFEQGLRTMLVAPLLIQEDLIGCLNIYGPSERRPFTQDEGELAMIFAHQASTAIHNARLYQETSRRNAYLGALLDASKAITSQSAVSRTEVLDRITEQAVQRLTEKTERKATWATIMLYDSVLNELSFESLYSPDLPRSEPYRRWSLDRGRAPDRKIGIVGRAVVERLPQRISDVRTDPDYIAFNSTTRSELAVPLVNQERILGVLALESDRVGAFDGEDERVLTGLAELAAIAIQNAEQADRLSRTNALALMGAWEAEVAHKVNREIGAIRRAVRLLQGDPALSADANERLREIDQAASELALTDEPGSGQLFERVVTWEDAALLDRVIQEEAEQLQSRYPAIKVQLYLNCPLVRVRIRALWLRRLIRHLAHNAIQAITPQCAEQSVTIRTICYESRVEVQVEDTGTGVDPALRPLLFERPIELGDGRAGRGLLLVRFVVEQHGGYARSVYSKVGKGSCFAFGLPLAEPG